MNNRTIKALIGLGNPGPGHYYQRHNIGFRVVDALVQKYGGSWSTKGEAEQASIYFTTPTMGTHRLLLIKPLTFMNASGRVIPSLTKQGIKAENILVVHDELELPFGVVKYKEGGSHKGHNGLRSIIGICGADFARMRCGIGRPLVREEVPDYVLRNFSEPESQVDHMIEEAVRLIEQICST